MRKIEIVDDVRLRFPDRGTEFDLGIEVGSVSVLIAQGLPLIERELSLEAVEQLRSIADHFGYSLVAVETTSEVMNVRLFPKSRSPALRLLRGGRL